MPKNKFSELRSRMPLDSQSRASAKLKILLDDLSQDEKALEGMIDQMRATRRAQKIRLDDLSGSAGVGHVFTREVEYGKETVRLGRVMKLLDELGIKLLVDMPDEVIEELARLRQTGLPPIKHRSRRAFTKEGKD